MTYREIERELEWIYQEMSLWPELNNRMKFQIPRQEVQRREMILTLQKILNNLEQAKKQGDGNKEKFNLTLYYLIKSRLKILRRGKV